MKIYSGNVADPRRLEKLKEYGMGIMLSTGPDVSFQKSCLSGDKVNGIRLALDNGAFGNRDRHIFNEFPFMFAINEILFRKRWDQLDFIACPDIVAGGLKSLEFSMDWVKRLQCDKLYLVIQDGMTPDDVEPYLENFKGLFIGGSMPWKLSVIEKFTKFAHSHEKRIHVGQIGRLELLNQCKVLGVDSVDSTSFIRNESWHIIEEHLNPKQMNLI